MNFTEPPCEPSWAFPFALAAIAILFVILIALAAWPILGRRRDDVDPHGEAYGDQPQVPL